MRGGGVKGGGAKGGEGRVECEVVASVERVVCCRVCIIVCGCCGCVWVKRVLFWHERSLRCCVFYLFMFYVLFPYLYVSPGAGPGAGPGAATVLLRCVLWSVKM